MSEKIVMAEQAQHDLDGAKKQKIKLKMNKKYCLSKWQKSLGGWQKNKLALWGNYRTRKERILQTYN